MLKSLLKRDSNTGVVLWIFRNFKENLFCRTSAYSCVWTDFRKWLFGPLFLNSRFQVHRVQNYLLGCRLGSSRRIQVCQRFLYQVFSCSAVVKEVIFWVAGQILAIDSKHARDFLFKFSVGRHLDRQLIHSLVPFHLWLGEVVLQREKVRKYFVWDCIKSIK